MTDYSELREKAKAATPGPWKWRARKRKKLEMLVGNGNIICDFGDDTEYYPTEGTPPNDHDMAYIAAADPQTVLSLLDRIAELEAASAEAEKRGWNAGIKEAASVFYAEWERSGDVRFHIQKPLEAIRALTKE